VPELLEIEQYRTLTDRVVGRQITSVATPDVWYLKRGATPESVVEAVLGRRVVAARRRGKLLLVDLSDVDPASRANGDGSANNHHAEVTNVLGLRFGMTGRLLVDGTAVIDELQYGSSRRGLQWDRFALGFADGGHLIITDPRRLGGVELDPDERALGPDAATVDRATLASVLRGSEAPIKARLMDQARLAGLGNLMTDDVLWRSGIDPARPARSLSGREVGRLHKALHETVQVLGERGGSHTGDLQAARVRGGHCPRCGTLLLRRTIGGRTTFSCPRHQRAHPRT
jgi:formamidopyrimidine-DNA glycosylase